MESATNINELRTKARNATGNVTIIMKNGNRIGGRIIEVDFWGITFRMNMREAKYILFQNISNII